MQRCVFGTGVLIFLLANSASAEVIDFESFSHGDELTSVTVGNVTVNFSAVNTGGGPDKLAIFDTGMTGTSDPDLEGPPSTNWAGGNLAPSTAVGKAFIIQENTTGYNPPGDTVFDDPDDEAGGGNINIDFGIDLLDIQFDFLDSEIGEVVARHYEIHFYDDGVELSGSPVMFEDFITASSPFYDPTIAFGNHYANTLMSISSSDVGGVFDEIELHISGSGGFDNLVFTPVPEPTTLLLLGIGLASLGVVSRRKRS
jgi:hypothetical protein